MENEKMYIGTIASNEATVNVNSYHWITKGEKKGEKPIKSGMDFTKQKA